MSATPPLESPAGALAGRRVLVIMGRLPWPMDDGWKMRSGNLLKGLAAKGACVDLLAFGDPAAPADAEFARRLGRVEVVPRRRAYAPADLLKGLVSPTPFSVLNYGDDAFAGRARAMGEDGGYDVVLVEDVVMAQYAECVRAPVRFLDMHNIESHLLRRYAEHERRLPRRLYASLTARKLAGYEARVARAFDAVFVCSEDDRRRLRAAAAGATVEVVPNGIDPAFFAASATADAPVDGSIVFVGSMDYHANISGVLHFAREVLPLVAARLPDVRTYVVGKNPPAEIRALASPSLVVTGAVDDVRPYLAAAGVTVVPLLVGGGTRLKILEAMGMGKAIVSTAVGAEGIDVRDGDTLLLADDPRTFADRVVELLRDPARAAAMGRRAREWVLRHYVWDAIVDRVAGAYASASAEAHAARGR